MLCPLQMPTLQRESVFSSIRQVPWQRMSSQMELGLPVGANPGSTGAAILLKRLNRQDNGSSTTLLQFPPGKLHLLSSRLSHPSLHLPTGSC